VLKLIALSGCSKEHQKFLDCVRRVRNAYAHDIRAIESTLIDMIEARNDKSELIRAFTPVEDTGYDEEAVIRMEKTEHKGLLRYGIQHQTMAILYLMHHAFPNKPSGETLSD
jgi:hypothetical protein